MTRFFFDIVDDASCVHDFHGRYFWTLEEARDMAETVSFDLACRKRTNAPAPRYRSAT